MISDRLIKIAISLNVLAVVLFGVYVVGNRSGNISGAMAEEAEGEIDTMQNPQLTEFFWYADILEEVWLEPISTTVKDDDYMVAALRLVQDFPRYFNNPQGFSQFSFFDEMIDMDGDGLQDLVHYAHQYAGGSSGYHQVAIAKNNGAGGYETVYRCQAFAGTTNYEFQGDCAQY